MKWIKETLKNNHIVDMDLVIKKESKNFPWLLDLVNTEQDPEWHAEGNVLIHTDMVIKETYKLFDNNNFSLQEKYILLMSAIFHDIAKPVTTRRKEINGIERVTAGKHEYQGLSYLFYPFLDLIEDEYERNAILELVGYHQKPKLLAVKNCNEWEYKFLTRNTAGYLFYYHQIADMKGRHCSDLEQQLLYLEEFKLFCEEYDCFFSRSNIEKELRVIFKNLTNENLTEEETSFLISKSLKDLINEEYNEPSVALQKYYETKSLHSNVYIMCGLSGSGKSSYVKHIKDYQNIDKVISLDEIRKQFKINNTNRQSIDGKVLQIAKQELKKSLAAKENVIWDACNIRQDFRKIIVDLVHNYSGKSILVFIKTPIKECINNDSKRIIGHLGEEIILQQLKKFQYPEDSEFDSVFSF